MSRQNSLKQVGAVLIVFLCAAIMIIGCAVQRSRAGRVGAAKQKPWRAVHIMTPGPDGLPLLKRAISEALAPMGVNVLILEVNYNFEFKSHPELRGDRALSKADVRGLAQLCRKHNIRLIPQLNCLGHQSWSRGGNLPLLAKYPELDETPQIPKGSKDIYCRSWCPLNPKVNEIVFPLMDELIEAFQADAFHVGMDEVFLIASDQCERCRGKNPAELFAKAVNDLHGHLVEKKGLTMLMWGDRLLDNATMKYSKWEASENGTAPAIDLVPRDIIMCDWHYGLRNEYPSVPYFQQKGFRVLPSGWKDAKAAVALRDFARRNATEKMIGHMCTTWSNSSDLCRALLGEGEARGNAKQSAQAAQAAQALRACFEATPTGATELGVQGSRFTVNGKPTFLLGISYYGALGASEEFIQRDLDDMQRCGFNWFRAWATWNAFEHDVSAVDVEGKPREPFLSKLKRLVAECDRRGMIVDVTLSRGGGKKDVARLQTLDAHRRAVETLATALKPYRNWYLDLANERNIGDSRAVSFAELKQLCESANQLDPRRLITASQAGDISRDDLRQFLTTVRVDFITPHRPRDAGSPQRTAAKTKEYLAWMKEIGRVVPVHYQEPFRRGFQPKRWDPPADAFIADLKQAIEGGAAGWCFHNGDQDHTLGGKPGRSFDMRERRLFDQLDDEEQKFLRALPSIMEVKQK